MRHYFILWEERSSSMKAIDTTAAHFYAIEKEGKLVYIGLCFGLNLEDEVAESMHVFGLDKADIKVWSGQIIRNIHNVVDQQLAEEVLCLMVYNIQPEHNIICKRSYYGREGLEIYNRGFRLVPQVLNGDKRVFVTSSLTGS